jgi:hypothetical protein
MTRCGELAKTNQKQTKSRIFREKSQGNLINKDSDTNFKLPPKKTKEFIHLKRLPKQNKKS